jgi:hypothetical protein
MNLRQALNNAVVLLLRPLVRVLLRHGLTYDEFAELARRTYVDVAERDFALKGRKQTASRISVITGLNRKEVARLQALNALSAEGDAGGAELAHTMNRAAKVVVGWMREHAPAGGEPAALDAAQFSALVRRHSGDMPARAVLDELKHAGALSATDDGRYRLAPQGYVPRQTDVRKIALLGQHAADLLGAIEHNLAQPPEQAYLQQRVFADHIPADRIATVRQRLRDTGLRALTDTRETLIEHDAGDAPPGPGARRVTLGVYYFEEPAAGLAAASATTAARGDQE